MILASVELLSVVSDVDTCLRKFQGTSEAAPATKRVKNVAGNDENKDEELESSWEVVLSDVLIVLLEQSCHYLRALATRAFKTLVTEGHCNVTVIEHIHATIERADGNDDSFMGLLILVLMASNIRLFGAHHWDGLL